MGTSVNVQEALVDSWAQYVWQGTTIPDCHQITIKILHRFVSMRWRIQGQRSTEEARDALKSAYGSKSAAMHKTVK